MSIIRNFSELVQIDFSDADGYKMLSELEEPQYRMVLLLLALNVEVQYDQGKWQLEKFLENVELDTIALFSVLGENLRKKEDDEPPWETNEESEF